MRINTNVMALNATRNASYLGDELALSLERLNTGSALNRAGDDAAGLVISQKLNAEASGLRQAARNAQEGISFLQTAEGALQEVHNLLNRMRQLAVQAANDSNDSTARASIKVELDALAAEIDRIGTDTTFSGRAVFTATAMALQLGAEGGSGNQILLSVGLVDANALGGAGNDLAALSVNTAANARTSIESIDLAIEAISTSRGALGAAHQRLDSTIRNLLLTADNLSASVSRISDTDIANEIARFSEHEILLATGTAMVGQASLISVSVLELLV